MPDFVKLFTITGAGREFFEGRASKAADGKYNINTQTLRGVVVPVPDLDEQREIASALSAVEWKLATEEQRMRALDALFGTLLRDVMSGRVRVPIEE